jgi:hypothetical protein
MRYILRLFAEMPHHWDMVRKLPASVPATCWEQHCTHILGPKIYRHMLVPRSFNFFNNQHQPMPHVAPELTKVWKPNCSLVPIIAPQRTSSRLILNRNNKHPFLPI